MQLQNERMIFKHKKKIHQNIIRRSKKHIFILKLHLSSPGTSSTSPGNRPSESTQESSSNSSAGSGVFRIRPKNIECFYH